MEPSRPLSEGSRFEDRYEILGELGSGSSGRVYRARQIATGQAVAIKLLGPRVGAPESVDRAVERFRRETRICAALSHTNIVGLIDSGETRGGQLYAVFALVPGETLEEVLARDGTVGVREALRLMTQVLEALDYAHAQGIVHRDLKPSNLMLSGSAPRRNAVVLDFGLGGLSEDRRRAEWQTLTQTQEFVGTPLYASPEQLAGEAATARSDLYSWGLVFLECLTGRHSFAKTGAAERLLSGGGTVEIPEWLRGHGLGGLLERATARRPEKRDVWAGELLEALDAMAGAELPVAPEEARAPAPLAEQGERRHLTVMFCDLVGSSALSQRLGAEAYRQVVQAYQARCAAVIERYHGHVAQYLGDGLLVYFGHPQAHEDDAERAVRAGRGILRELEILNPHLEAEHGERLQVRVGIHTGAVVVGKVGGRERRETLALGDTPNIAARLEGFAEPGTLMISETTLRLVVGLFVTEDLGTPELKGIAEPVRVYKVIRPSGVVSRLDRAPRLTPFVGREQELGLLRDRFEQAAEQQGQTVWITGEAGIGKSRLVHRFREKLRGRPHSWLECRSSPYTQNSALYPVIELVERALGFKQQLALERKLERLERELTLVGLEPEETVPLLASLLSLRLPERYPPLELSPQLQRQRTLETLLAWVLALGERQPVVLVVEDLHWADPSTLEWLGLLIEQGPTAAMLLLLTFRPDFEVPWPSRGHVLPIALSRLGRRRARELVAAAAGEALPDEVVDRLTVRSDGIPLFVEELAKGVVESGRALASSASSLEIPETLQDLLMARLDGLGDAKLVAQLGAAIGREFPYALLEAVAPMKEAALREGLGRLVDAELVYQRGLPPKATYTFKHALVQDAAYQSLLDSQRKELHGRIAGALEGSAEKAGREPELLARHLEEAGRVAQAVEHYQRAAEHAAQRWAHDEALAYLGRAIELLRTLPDGPERNRRELHLQILLGASLQSVRGHGNPEVEETYARALALSRQVGDASERFQALSGIVMFYRNNDAERAIELSRELLKLAERTGETSRLLIAHSAVGNPLVFHGDFSEALEHHEHAIALYDPTEHRSLQLVYGVDPGISSLCLASTALWHLGYPDQALDRTGQAIELARKGNQPFSLVYALSWRGGIHAYRGEDQLAGEFAVKASAIAAERGFPFFLASGLIYRAWTLAVASDAQEAGGSIDELRRTLREIPHTGRAPIFSHHLGLVADAERRIGRLQDAMRSLAAGLDWSAATHAPFWDPELHRLKGEVRLAQDPAATREAESLFLRALEIAKAQEARSLELRAATSLARLWHRQGRGGDARAQLEPVYAWFTEGFDTADLLGAKALLDALTAASPPRDL